MVDIKGFSGAQTPTYIVFFFIWFTGLYFVTVMEIMYFFKFYLSSLKDTDTLEAQFLDPGYVA